MSLTLTQPKPREQIAIIADTDMHGGLSLAASWLALRKAGIEPTVAYSNFQLVKPGETPTQPVTNAQWLADSLPQIVSPANFRGIIYILDIPMNNLAPQKHAEALKQYTAVGSRVVVVNKAGHDPEIAPKLYADAGIDYIPVDTDIAVALFIPRKYGVVDNDIYRIAKWAALGDFDPSIEREVTYEEEELVTEWIDQYWKFESKNDPAIPSEYRVRYGNVGALARMVVEHGLEWLERRAREVAKPIPTPQYEVRGDVAIVYGPEIPGMAWKLAAKACRLSGAKVAVAKAVSPRGQAVIIATNWRWKAKLPQLTEIVDRVANEIAEGRSVVGNPGARSILARSNEDVELLMRQAVEKLNQYIQSYAYTPRVAHLISERTVAEAIMHDYRALYSLLERVARALERGASAKERQVSLLEKLYQQRGQEPVRGD